MYVFTTLLAWKMPAYCRNNCSSWECSLSSYPTMAIICTTEICNLWNLYAVVRGPAQEAQWIPTSPHWSRSAFLERQNKSFFSFLVTMHESARCNSSAAALAQGFTQQFLSLRFVFFLLSTLQSDALADEFSLHVKFQGERQVGSSRCGQSLAQSLTAPSERSACLPLPGPRLFCPGIILSIFYFVLSDSLQDKK